MAGTLTFKNKTTNYKKKDPLSSNRNKTCDEMQQNITQRWTKQNNNNNNKHSYMEVEIKRGKTKSNKKKQKEGVGGGQNGTHIQNIFKIMYRTKKKPSAYVQMHTHTGTNRNKQKQNIISCSSRSGGKGCEAVGRRVEEQGVCERNNGGKDICTMKC